MMMQRHAPNLRKSPKEPPFVALGMKALVFFCSADEGRFFVSA